MNISYIDISIVVIYFIAAVLIGFIISKKASKNMKTYFLGGKKLPWYILGVSDASGMFDISGTMWMVMNAFMFGVRSIYLTWIWPVFNQIFLMVFMSAWVRRSNVLTGAEWLQTRFGKSRMLEATNVLIVVFAIVSAIGYFAYAFAGIGKFAEAFLPWNLAFQVAGIKVQSFQTYAILITFVTGLYAVKGGLPSVVVTEVLQFVVLTVSCFLIAFITMNKVSNEQIMALVPKGWDSMMITWKMNLDWSRLMPDILHQIQTEGYSWFTIIIMMMLFKGILSSIAGPVPNYDMQRILATKSPSEASKMNGFVSVVLLVPRYLLITSLTVLAIVYLSPHLKTEAGLDFEEILPLSVRYCLPVGVVGILLSGLIAAFMSNFTANVNAPPAYIVNDIYKKYFKPDMPEKHYVKISYLVSFIMLLVGIVSGMCLQSINAGMQWLFAGLFGGYAAPNVLKWVWWRYNCSGYFWGMLAGLAGALTVPLIFPNLNALYGFPIILVMSLIGCIAGTFAVKPDDEEMLMDFLHSVRPWGFWEPIRKKLKETRNITLQTHLKRHIFNCFVGVIGQTCLMALGMYIILKDYSSIIFCVVVIAVCAVILKFSWWDKIED